MYSDMLQVNTKWLKTKIIIIHCLSLFALAALAQHEKVPNFAKQNIEQLNMQCHLECSCMVAIAMLTKQKSYRLHLAMHDIWQMLIIIVQVSLNVSCHYCNNMRTTRYSLQIFVIWPMIIARFLCLFASVLFTSTEVDTCHFTKTKLVTFIDMCSFGSWRHVQDNNKTNDITKKKREVTNDNCQISWLIVCHVC